MVILLAFLVIPALGQNTKGDRPASNREGRFKTSPRKEKKPIFSKRVRSQGRSASNSASGRRRTERPGKRLKPVFSVKKPSDKQRAWKGDITGRRVRHKNASSSQPYVHPQPPGVRRRIPDKEGRQNVQGGSARSVRPKSATGKTKNVFPQYQYTRPAPRPRDRQQAVSNRGTLARLKKLQSIGEDRTPQQKIKIVPRSASRPFIRNKSINVFAQFPRPKRKRERAQTTDIAGRRIRGRNYHTPARDIIPPPPSNAGKRRPGDRAYGGPNTTYKPTRKSGNRAWAGDVTGHRLLHRNRSSKKSVEGMPSLFRGRRSATRTGEVGAANGGYRSRSRSGQVGAANGGYRSRSRNGQVGVGNGGYRSRSGKGMSNARLPLKAPGLRAKGMNSGGKSRLKIFQQQGENYSGFIKARRQYKGGGSVSGKGWNNDGRAIPTKTPGIGGQINRIKGKYVGGHAFSDQGEQYTGSIKARRKEKRGGSVSGKGWNNNGQPIVGRQPRQGQVAANFAGNIKRRRAQKGGGSVSGEGWNNNGQPIIVRQPKQGRGAATYAGNIKVRKGASDEAKKAATFRGSKEQNAFRPGYADQGEEFTGVIKLSKWKRNYVQNKNANEESIKKRRLPNNIYATEGLQVKVKRRDYVRNKNANEDALMKLKQTETSQRVAGLHVKVQRRDYVKNPNASESALKKLKPTKTDQQVAGLQVRVKQYNYRHNPSSASDALKVREPGKAFARATDYQGNIKMQKFRLFDRNRRLHPDAQFVKTNKNNVAGEKDAVTNLKLWWARLFKKQDTQPEHLKEKGRKPRYDKGEQGLWYE
jgi:hypothetical protein